MATKQAALALAAKFGLELDESVTGRIGESGTVTFDHPTHSFGGDCRSITVSGFQPMAELWQEAIDRMREEGPHLTPCTCPDCDYHAGGDTGQDRESYSDDQDRDSHCPDTDWLGPAENAFPVIRSYLLAGGDLLQVRRVVGYRKPQPTFGRADDMGASWVNRQGAADALRETRRALRVARLA
jgi:hypothetical protein